MSKKINKNIKEVEAGTLATFKKHRPSEYFSHLVDDGQAFKEHNEKVGNLFRYGLNIPLDYFDGKEVIDLGSGTGENLISLATWGAKCTLVEMNEDALEVAKQVFKKYSPNFKDHKFIHSSLYDLDHEKFKNKFDISHSRGVFTHVADKARAFNHLASYVKPGGYVIYGDRNTAGGIQEMLQRLAIYKLGGDNDEKIIEISEALFSDDITRSQQSVPRTREAIIFDRWVIQQQDDPSVKDVLDMFCNEGLDYISSWPRLDFAGRGVSTYTDPKNDNSLKRGARLVENLWMMLNQGENENIDSYLGLNQEKYLDEIDNICKSLRNLQIGDDIDILDLSNSFDRLGSMSFIDKDKQTYLNERQNIFIKEVISFLNLIKLNRNPKEIRKEIDNYNILFKGYAGVRHLDYVAYKPN